MTRYVYYTATTLDGFLADEHDSLDWLLRQPQDEASPYGYDTFITGIGALVMGATTYRWILDHNAATGEPWTYEQPTFVFSHHDLAATQPRVARLTGSAEDARATLEQAAGGKDVWMVGGGALAADFARAGMLDEVIVSIAPVTLGAGRPLLTGRFDLELLDSGTSGAFVCARYRVAGPLTEDRQPGVA